MILLKPCRKKAIIALNERKKAMKDLLTSAIHATNTISDKNREVNEKN